jgi:2',3'-cyclic-nucleotide 2'-phosphodiesterase (5'-nucleotidase family)
VTVADLVSLVPFEEAVAVAELSGAELRSALREAAHATGFGEADWWHAHLSGAEVVYDYADDAVLEARVREEAIDDDARYRLAVSEFLLNTDTEFPTLSEGHAVDRLDTQYEVLAEYARTVGVDPRLEGRVVRRGL